MRIICVDPGELTGVIVFNPNSNVLLNLTLKIEIVASLIDGLQPKILIVEKKPKYADWSNELSSGYWDIINRKVELFRITPGIWKPVAKARNWKFPRGKSQHEKDAYNILRYFFFSRHKFDIGEDICQTDLPTYLF